MKNSAERIWPYKTLGVPTSPALVLLHGFLGNNDDWAETARLLSDSYFCIMPDLPGHGINTSRMPNAPISLIDFASELKSLINKLNLYNVNLLGYSMGGRLALTFAIQFPKLVNTLILESANPGIQESNLRRQRASEDAQRANQINKIGLDKFIDTWYEIPLFESLSQHGEKFNELKAKRKHNDATWAIKTIAELSPGVQPELWSSLNKVSMPTLFLAGQLDQKYTKLSARALGYNDLFKLVIIPNAGHNIHFEHPHEFFLQVIKFLNHN
ncbi:MAG: 2-succinyl-6-hydroxy-2,4-cyclohexadiene-1-carboxylate synthase [Chloroflexota bacterium]